MTKPAHNYKLTTPQRMQIFALMARGDTQNQINDFLKKNHNVTLSPSNLSLMKSRHKETIEAMVRAIQENELAGVEKLMKKSHRLLGRKLDRAEREMTELEELDEAYRNNKISPKEYKRIKTTLLDVSILEIASVSKNLHVQTGLSQPEISHPASAGAPIQTEALLNAIKNGDTVELQRIILNPNAQISHPA